LAAHCRGHAVAASVWAADGHGEAIFGWSEAWRSGDLRTPATVVHFDSHADMAMPRPLNASASSLELAARTEINDFVTAAVALGIVDRVVWVRPEWAIEHEHGHFRYALALDPAVGAFVSDAPFAMGLQRSPEVVGALPGARHFELEVIPFSQESLDVLASQLQPQSFILDVDLDTFATENHGCRNLRRDANLTVAEIQRVVACACEQGLSDAEWDAYACGDRQASGWPLRAELLARAGALSKGAVEDSLALLCGQPVRYSSEADVEVGVNMLVSWVQRLQGAGTLPGVVTVAESTDGYLPPQYLDRLRPVAGKLADALGVGPPTWVPCTRCVALSIVNDLEVPIEVFWVGDKEDGPAEGGLTEGRAPPVLVASLAPGAREQMDSFSGHAFDFRADAEGAQPQFRRGLVHFGAQRQELRLSALLEATPQHPSEL